MREREPKHYSLFFGKEKKKKKEPQKTLKEFENGRNY